MKITLNADSKEESLNNNTGLLNYYRLKNLF